MITATTHSLADLEACCSRLEKEPTNRDSYLTLLHMAEESEELRRRLAQYLASRPRLRTGYLEQSRLAIASETPAPTAPMTPMTPVAATSSPSPQ